MLQAILLHAPEIILQAIWQTYFVGKVGKLASHPIGNYVVSSGIKRLQGERLKAVMLELEAVGVSNLIRKFDEMPLFSAATRVLIVLVGNVCNQVPHEHRSSRPWWSGPPSLDSSSRMS